MSELINSVVTSIPDDQLRKLTFSVAAILIAYVLSFFIKKSVDVIVGSIIQSRFTPGGTWGRTSTIRSLLKNIIDIAVFVTVLLIILSYWDVNIMPLLTGAGLAGLAVSFGAQTLVKDIIAGFFIIVEDQYRVGDQVILADSKGTVMEITLRLTVLKNKDGNLVYVPNSQITKVVRIEEKKK